MPTSVEVIGYLASAFIAVSLLMVSFVKLRIINLIGCVFFVVYGTFIGAIPVIVTNGFIAGVNIYYLVRIRRTNTNGFSYVGVTEEGRGRIAEFVARYAPDIRKYYPAFAVAHIDRALEGAGRVYLALKDLRVEGLACYLRVQAIEDSDFSFELDGESGQIADYIRTELYPEHSVFMPIDYITARFRDLGLVHKLHRQMLSDLPADINFVIVVAARESRKTDRFLRKNGHVRTKVFAHYALYVKTLR